MVLVRTSRTVRTVGPTSRWPEHRAGRAMARRNVPPWGAFWRALQVQSAAVLLCCLLTTRRVIPGCIGVEITGMNLDLIELQITVNHFRTDVLPQ